VVVTIAGIAAKIATRSTQVDSISLTSSARRALEIAIKTPNSNLFVSVFWLTLLVVSQVGGVSPIKKLRGKLETSLTNVE